LPKGKTIKPNQGFEIMLLKRKIQNQRAEIDRLKLALKTCKALLAKAKAKGFSPRDVMAAKE
jgi:hypothetical protein